MVDHTVDFHFGRTAFSPWFSICASMHWLINTIVLQYWNTWLYQYQVGYQRSPDFTLINIQIHDSDSNVKRRHIFHKRNFSRFDRICCYWDHLLLLFYKLFLVKEENTYVRFFLHYTYDRNRITRIIHVSCRSIGK